MTKLTQLDDNPLYYQDKYTDSVSEMVYPFIDELKITFFSHVRVWHTGVFKSLMTETNLSRFYMEHKYPIRFSLGNNIILNSGCYLLKNLPNLSSQQELNVTRDKFNLDHLIYLVDKQPKWDDLFILATTPENGVFVNLVFNNLDFIKQGLHRYKYYARELLKKAPGMSYPSHYFMEQEKQYQYKLQMDRNILHKILLPLNDMEVSISKQEYHCLGFLIQNRSVKEIAQLMNLSPRTVETYLNNLKSKLHCQNNSELIQFIHKLYLF